MCVCVCVCAWCLDPSNVVSHSLWVFVFISWAADLFPFVCERRCSVTKRAASEECARYSHSSVDHVRNLWNLLSKLLQRHGGYLFVCLVSWRFSSFSSWYQLSESIFKCSKLCFVLMGNVLFVESNQWRLNGKPTMCTYNMFAQHKIYYNKLNRYAIFFIFIELFDCYLLWDFRIRFLCENSFDRSLSFIIIELSP